MTVNLRQLLPGVTGVPDVEVAGLATDSRQVEPGDLFIALRGARTDGHDHVSEAVARGAQALLVERPIAGVAVPLLVRPALREELGPLAARFFGEPAADLHCIGVTGTNGKTSIAFYLADLASRLGRPTGYIGTIGWGTVVDLEAADLTTPDPIGLHRRLAALRDRGCRWVALEVSSHALEQGRVLGVPFKTAIFSNLTRDHLDYHGDMAAYGAAKARLFSWPGLERAIINHDDPFGRQLLNRVDPTIDLVRFGRRVEAGEPGALVIEWSGLRFDVDGVSGRWHTPWGEHDFRLPVHAEFSVANVAAALAVLCSDGVALEDFVAAGAALAQVPGRMEFFRAADGPTVVVDFAHTPDAVRQALQTLRPRTAGRLVCVFGCGGDRDAGKRPLMAAAAEETADVLWLTSDNPRSEQPEAIIDQMRAGLAGRSVVFAETDRRRAIAAAIADAGRDDVVLVAGKGHEAYQEIGGRRLPFSDRLVVDELLRRAS